MGQYIVDYDQNLTFIKITLIIQMATSDARKNLAERNQILRQEYTRLKEKKQDLDEHIVTIDRRLKQMTALKASLANELRKAEEEAKITRNKKIAYIGFLREDITRLQIDLANENIKLKNLQAQYDVCLKDYDNVVAMVTAEIEKVKLIETDILKEKQSDSSMKAMIFDYQRLKRVLEEERKYFRELNISEEKSHEERIKELKNIRDKLIKEETNEGGNHKLSKFRIGIAKIQSLFKQKIKQYAECFLSNEIKVNYKTELGVRTFRNCVELGNFKHKQSMRKIFYRWHHNIFPKNTLKNLVEDSLEIDVKSRRKIITLNKMIEKMNSDNLSLFHLYEKMRFLMVTANKVSRKDMHYGFTKWRNNYSHKTQTLNKLHRMLAKTIPTYEKRTSFKLWKENAFLKSRFQRANFLLSEFLSVKELSRVFRKWRFQCPNEDLKTVNDYIYNVKLRNKISSRINYEKRKTKAITALAFKMTKIKLRNYFTKYWANVKSYRISEVKDSISDNREQFSTLRVKQKQVTTHIKAKDKKFSLKTFRAFMMNMKLKPVMRKWRNTIKVMKRRQEVLLHLAIKRQAKSKIYVMNQFRKCVQYHEKKEMHQVLTDLNNKMEAINEKSTMFRERLKKCVEDLGVMASKKIASTYNYSVRCQTRVYFDQDLRLRVKKLYHHYILNRLDVILNQYCAKNAFNEILMNSKDKKREAFLEKHLEKVISMKENKKKQGIFYYLKNTVTAKKGTFKNMIQSENVMMFYRMASAFVAIQRKNFFKKVEGKKKQIVSSETALQQREQNLMNLGNQKEKLNESLKKIFTNFINFQNRNMEIKSQKITETLTKRYFKKYRENVREKVYIEQVLNHFISFLNQKNSMIFWKSLTAIRYQKMITLVKEQLTKINKKKKAFQEKSDKGRSDLSRKMEEEEAVHEQHQQYYEYYLNKFQGIIQYYMNKHIQHQKQYYMKEIFTAWKREYQGAKRITLTINKIFQKKLVYKGYEEVVTMLKKMDAQMKSQMMCADILLKKGRNCMKDCMILWRCNLRKLKCEKMEEEANVIIDRREVMKEQCQEKSHFISEEVIRVKKRKLLIKCFMAFKNEVIARIHEQNKIKPIQEQINQRVVATAIKGWKWLMFYKKTKRSYLKYKKQKNDYELKKDVFMAIKIYREEHLYFADRLGIFVETMSQQYLRFAMDKLINVGAYERDELNYERRRALRHLLMNKVTRVQVIKKKIMAKWHAWLIPRTHYLPNVLKQLEIRALRRYLGNIKEHAYWNDFYIKSIADKVTSEGYGGVNTATNNLIKEGYDPDEIKEYLTKKNEKDSKIIKNVVCHIQNWGQKEDLVRAWHSWKQYLQLKGKIKKSLSKVLNIAQGLGRYWNRWKSKDPKFNAILEKESRGNMLSKYDDLSRLLKEYKRDIRDSKVYCEELKDINNEYREKNEEGIKMALSTLSGNLKVSLKQGMTLWRNRVREMHREELDDRYEQLGRGIEMLYDQKNKIRYRIAMLRDENTQLKEKCNLGAECGRILERLLTERDNLSIDLADKEHNIKLLLEDNLRLKQKIRAAQSNAEKLINKVQNAREQQ